MKPPGVTNLGRILRAYRLLGELEQRTLAKRIGISASTLCRLEMGHQPDATIMLHVWTWMLTLSEDRR
jgi:transcriptional regulator with XRE-family HTH domain